MCTADGRWPRFHSRSSRTSMSVTSSPRSCMRRTSDGVTSVIRCLASVTRSAYDRSGMGGSVGYSRVCERRAARGERRLDVARPAPLAALYVERLRVRVHLGPGAERHGPLVVDVADGDAGQARNAECVGGFGEHVVEGACSVVRLLGAARAMAEQERAATVEETGHEELAHH